MSLSARRAWIEIVVSMALDQYLKSLSARRAWIEITGTMGKSNRAIKSLSARRAWIEILKLS